MGAVPQVPPPVTGASGEGSLSELGERSRQLPVWSKRAEIIRTVEEHQVVLIVGDTGCGKTTQVSCFLFSLLPWNWKSFIQRRAELKIQSSLLQPQNLSDAWMHFFYFLVYKRFEIVHSSIILDWLVFNPKPQMLTFESLKMKSCYPCQVPQMLLEDACISGRRCRMICTQPRRLVAHANAERVAAERGETVGQTVGYQIRLESKWVVLIISLVLFFGSCKKQRKQPKDVLRS